MNRTMQLVFSIVVSCIILFLIFDNIKTKGILKEVQSAENSLREDVTRSQGTLNQLLAAEKARIDAAVKSDLKTLRTLLESMYSYNQWYPDKLSELPTNYPVLQKDAEVTFEITERWPNGKGRNYRITATHIMSDFNYVMTSDKVEIQQIPKNKL